MRSTLAYYEARAALGFAAVAPSLLLPVYGVFMIVNWFRSDRILLLSEVMPVFAILLPLSAGLSAAHLMVVEREENVDALRRSYAEPTWRLPLIRTIGALMAATVSVGVTVVLLRAAGVSYPIHEMVLPAVPATLLMVGMALLAGNVTGNTPAAVMAVVAYWFMDLQMFGRFTGAFYLFNAVSPLPDVDPGLNQLLLCVAAWALCLGNIAWSARRRRVGG